jgi:acetolactate synthase-1/2/3 large subunit
MNGARTVVEMLKKYETEIIFGVPGDTNIGLYEALYDVAPAIPHIMARDERSTS